MQVEIVIIGAGIIGLAIGRELAQLGREVLIIEANEAVGQEGTFRNSAVLHAGIYYPPNSLKARFCRHGQALLYDYCQTKQIAHKIMGKLIIATNEQQLITLKQLAHTAQANQVTDLEWLSATEAQAMEPQIKCLAALYSPRTGIVNGQQLSLALKNDVESKGGNLWLQTKFLQAAKLGDEFQIKLNSAQEADLLSCQIIINAAGLNAVNVAQQINGIKKSTIPQSYYAKGNYFKYLKPNPFTRLIYPVPEKAGLGIHATIDLQGQMRFGPDVEWIDNIDYKVNSERQNYFVSEIIKYFPGITAHDLQADFAGIRPKISSPNDQPQDFLIHDAQIHGVKNLINLYGIESPGLTSSLAIAEYVSSLLSK